MAAFDQFIHQYQVSKTLRFALIPQGKTLENITKNNVLKEDDDRQKNYEKVKPILDRIYKVFAEESLKNCSVDWSDLDDCLDTYQKNPSAEKRQKVKPPRIHSGMKSLAILPGNNMRMEKIKMRRRKKNRLNYTKIFLAKNSLMEP